MELIKLLTRRTLGTMDIEVNPRDRIEATYIIIEARDHRDIPTSNSRASSNKQKARIATVTKPSMRNISLREMLPLSGSWTHKEKA